MADEVKGKDNTKVLFDKIYEVQDSCKQMIGALNDEHKKVNGIMERTAEDARYMMLVFENRFMQLENRIKELEEKKRGRKKNATKKG